MKKFLKDNYESFILILILLIAAFLFYITIISLNYILEPDIGSACLSTQESSPNPIGYVEPIEVAVEEDIDPRNYIECDCEKRFKKDYPIAWSGRVISTFVSGEDFGVERYQKDIKYKQFYVNGKNMYKVEQGTDVRVEGRLVGITCAYANTVFGECVGEVVADKITLLN